MGESDGINLRLGFNPSIRIESRPLRLTSNVGVLLLREIDDIFGISSFIDSKIVDPRNPALITHPFIELLRCRLYLMAQGWRDQDDADALRHDPALRIAVSNRSGRAPLEVPSPDEGEPNGLASQPTHSRVIVHLSSDHNRGVLGKAIFNCGTEHYLKVVSPKREENTLDIDSFSVAAYGTQPGSAYNGYYHMRCFHPIVVFLADTGDIIGAQLRAGNVHTANGVQDFLFPIITQFEEKVGSVTIVRGDAGFPEEGLIGGLEAKKIGYNFRIKRNKKLDAAAEPFVKQFKAKPCGQAFHELEYGAQAWTKTRRLVLVIIEIPGKEDPNYFFLLTHWSLAERSGEQVLEHYRERGSAEGLIGEFKSRLTPALSSTNRSKSTYKGEPVEKHGTPRDAEQANAVTFMLFVIAYNLLNIARQVSSQPEVDEGNSRWSIGRLQERVLGIAARLIFTGRRIIVQISEVFRDHWIRAVAGLEKLRAQLVNSS